MDRDKYGNYVNDEGVTIKITTDKNGNDHVSFYGGPVDEDHSAVHVNVDYEKSSWNSNTHGEDHSDSDSGSGGCYLTSACLSKYSEKFDDDCYELRTLRWFRDNFVSHEDISHYYAVAPRIVSMINQQPNNKAIYNSIYNSVINPCVNAIEAKNFKLAYEIYSQTVLSLEKKYAV